jgi:hypothetical protein
LPYIKRFIFVFVIFQAPAFAYQNLSAGIGGGYSGNLFADSFAVGNSYLINKVSVSSTNFSSIRLKLYYDFSFYKYDTGDLINNFYHVPGVALYRRGLGQRFRWGIETCAAIKDYISASSKFDNFRIFSNVDASYYFGPGLQGKAFYRLIRSKYANYGDLDNFEHWVDGELVATLPSKTTLRGIARYSVRRFDTELVTFHWIDTQFGLSQSIDIRTGLSFSFLRRWSRGGERPLASYYIISGITSYWDPWQGNQVELAIKRILPYAIISKWDGWYWKRVFTYDEIMRSQLPWLRDKSGRSDEGWLAGAEFNRQYNMHLSAPEALVLALKGGYISNTSNDPFYGYSYFFINLNISISIF